MSRTKIRLQNIIKGVDNHLEETIEKETIEKETIKEETIKEEPIENHVKKSTFRGFIKKYKLTAGIAAVAILIALVSLDKGSTVRPSTIKELEGQPSQFNCGLDNDSFYLEPVVLKTELGGYDAHINLDIGRDDIVSIDNYDNFTLAVYTKEDRLNQLLISDDVPKELQTKDINTKKLGKDSVVTVNETSASALKRIGGGYMYYEENLDGTPKSEDIKKDIDNISNSIQYSEHEETSNIVLNIEGIGTLNLNELSVFKDNAGMYYGKDKILRLYNNKDDIAYIWITHINNSLMMNPIGNLKATEYNNVYVDLDYNNPEKMGYKTYAIMTSSGLYSIKFNEKSPDGLEDELLDKLGISKDDAKIELQFKLNE